MSERRIDTAVLLAAVAVEIAAITVVVRLFPLVRALRMLGNPGPGRARRPERVLAAIDRVFRLNRLVWTPSCWKRSIVLHRALRRAGKNCRIVWGVRENGALLDGHAWVEMDGVAVGESEAPAAYQVVLTYP